MKAIIPSLFAALIAASVLPGIADAQGYPTQTTIFGTIVNWERPNVLEVRTWRSGVNHIDVRVAGSKIIYDGQPLRAGTFGGFTGYFGPGRRYFVAQQITLSSSPQDYPGQIRSGFMELVGTIDRINPGRFLIDTADHGHVWVYTAEHGLHVGQRVQIWGNYNPWSGTMQTRHVTVL